MNEIIKKQLEKCSLAKVGVITDETKHIFIPQIKNIKLEEDQCYIIELSDYVLNEITGSTLAVNWNNGKIPKSKYWKIDVVKIMAHMVKINGISFDYRNNKDLNELWEGWVPIDSILILERI